MRLYDFYCGSGALSWAFRSVGFSPVFAIDKEAEAVSLYIENIGIASVVRSDVREFASAFSSPRPPLLEHAPFRFAAIPSVMLFHMPDEERAATQHEHACTMLMKASFAHTIAVFLSRRPLGDDLMKMANVCFSINEADYGAAMRSSPRKLHIAIVVHDGASPLWNAGQRSKILHAFRVPSRTHGTFEECRNETVPGVVPLKPHTALREHEGYPSRWAASSSSSRETRVRNQAIAPVVGVAIAKTIAAAIRAANTKEELAL